MQKLFALQSCYNARFGATEFLASERPQQSCGGGVCRRRIYFHNGVVTIVLWFVLVPKECAAVVVEPSGGQKEPLKMTLSTSDLLSSTVIVRDHHGLINECLTDTKCLPNQPLIKMLAKCDIYGHFNDTMQSLRSEPGRNGVCYSQFFASVCKNAYEWENWKLLDFYFT